ncbi:GSCOCG00013161001-RA-CDS [Cotesia congregata]|nr:GSCOCG00013161001-RA-CDS [Cotesia congregata]
MNSPNKNRNITKTQLTEKLKADIDILTNDLKKTLTNLETAAEFEGAEEKIRSLKNKPCKILKLVDYLKIMKYLKKDLNEIEKKCGEFIRDVSKFQVESVGVGELISLYASEDEDTTNSVSMDGTDQLSQSFKDVLISSNADASNLLQADSVQPLLISIKLENFTHDSQSFFTSSPSDPDYKNKRFSNTKEEIPSKVPRLSHKIIDFSQKEEIEKIDDVKKEALSDLSNLADIKDRILVPKMYQTNQSNEHVKFTKFVWKRFYDPSDQEDVSLIKTICVECTDQDKFTYIATLSFTTLNSIELAALNSGKIILVVSHSQFDSWISKFLMWRTEFSNRNKMNLYILSKENMIDFVEWSETGGVLVINFDMFQQIYYFKQSMEVAKQSIYDCIFDSEINLFIFDLLCSENKDDLDLEIVKQMTNLKLIFGIDHKIINFDDQCYHYAAEK